MEIVKSQKFSSLQQLLTSDREEREREEREEREERDEREEI